MAKVSPPELEVDDAVSRSAAVERLEDASAELVKGLSPHVVVGESLV